MWFGWDGNAALNTGPSTWRIWCGRIRWDGNAVFNSRDYLIHLKFCLPTPTLGMVLTNWANEDTLGGSLTKPSAGFSVMWLNIVAGWIIMLVYM